MFHPVSVEKANPQYAALLQERLGCANGEMKAARMYFGMSSPSDGENISEVNIHKPSYN